MHLLKITNNSTTTGRHLDGGLLPRNIYQHNAKRPLRLFSTTNLFPLLLMH
ncbi:hypothetical protein L917_17247 [Phytophthora nicotianae]|uniref:Uncharacterized protein n=1 Tax=Phytophthora nicotianae TaxID=4792 RepID=W2KC15_PHYNI|nr:hypothetical protein L917_17247 [Phytophthora nicotianae]